MPSDEDIPKSFESLWNVLDRDKRKYEYPYGHQSKILEHITKEMRSKATRDFAISLPTGTGKTAVGLLLAYLTMLQEKMKAIYLCPNVFLCDQVLRQARELGIPVVALYGSWTDIPDETKMKFIGGSAIGVATYATLFNSNPQTGNVGIIILDDIHAAGDAIISNWTIKISKDRNLELFRELSATLYPILNKSQRQALELKPRTDEQCEMLYSKQWLSVVDDVIRVCRKHSLDPELKYNWRIAESKIECYFCFLSYNTIEIRAITPPTYTISPFSEARYRFYMSATLDRTGNLENIAGIEEVKWIGSNNVDIPGNRLILNLNTLVPTTSDENRVVFAANKVDKLVVLTQSALQQMNIEEALVNAKYKGKVFAPGRETIFEELKAFKQASRALIILAGRYDGIDLGEGIADGILIYHLPQAINSFERFTTQKWETKDEAEARAIQRVHQGMGRCTRRESDEVQIFLVGEDLSKVLLDPQVVLEFPGKLRAELEACQAMNESKNLNRLMNSFKTKDEDWRTFKTNVNKRAAKLGSDVQSLHESRVKFRFTKFSDYLWTGDFGAAMNLAASIAERLVSDNSRKESAIWFYLAGVASDILSFLKASNPYLAPGNGYFSMAVWQSLKRDWFGSLSNYSTPEAIQPNLKIRIGNIQKFLKDFPLENNSLNQTLSESLRQLSSNEDTKVRQFLNTLGKSLGFETQIKKRIGLPDCVWYINSEVIFIFEAKTDKNNDCLSMNEVRQINSQPEEVRNNENLSVPRDLYVTCLTDCEFVAKEKIQEAYRFHIIKTDEMKVFAETWYDRLMTVHRRAFKDPAYLAIQLQSAMVAQKLDEKNIRAVLNVGLAENRLKPK